MAATAAVYNRLHNSSLGGGVAHHTQLARILEDAHHSGELILTNRKLKDFPKTGTKYNLGDTVIADLSRNRFCELPEEITSFSFLETLLLYHNTIRSIPESVKHLTSLTYLDLRSNHLSALPREICFLPLQVLLVSNNRLAALPDELGRMDRLTDLDASYNQLSSLPARIGELRSLRSLSLRSNQLMYLPREITCLSLISLDVSNNRIASLPLEIRQMSALVEFNLEHNPLTSPPASLCIRGLVHVFKFLETQATKDEKGSRAGGNYDGYTTLRRAPRHNSNSNILESNRVPRHPVDSGYSTCDGIDKRWSHDMPNVKPKTDSPTRRTPTTPPSSLSSELMDASLTSSTNTIVDESISVTAAVKPLNNDTLVNMSPIRRQDEQLSTTLPPTTVHQHINYAQSSSSNGSSPDQEDVLLEQHQLSNQNGKSDEKLSKNLGNYQTYREYKEALKQQRNLDTSNVYKMKGQKTLYDMSEASNALNSNHSQSASNEELEARFNGSASQNNTLPKSIMKNGTSNAINGLNTSSCDDCLVIPKKPVQKVIPSRNTELMSAKTQSNDAEKSTGLSNGDCVGYVKPSSPMKSMNGGSGGILTNNNKFTGLKSPINNPTKLSTPKTHRTVTWNHDIPPEKLSFTMRREFDRQREETELMTQLRTIIETRLKMTLPEDIASALTDGVILCHLANYVRPRSVASIHVPSPGVTKLTMARCRRNVDNFLEACRKIGVDEELICSCQDVVPPANEADCNNSNNNDSSKVEHTQLDEEQVKATQQRQILPNPSAVLKTVSALIAMDNNPHHQNIRNLQQQHEMQLKLQRQLRQQQVNYQYQQRFIEEKEARQEEQQEMLHEIELEQEQHTATGTKEQMRHQHEIVFDNSTINFKAECEFENIMLNGAVNGDEMGLVEEDSVGNVKNVSNGSDVTHVVSNFLRHAKLKTFQKIKLNLSTSHGNNNNNNNTIQQQSTVATTLHTIVEAGNDSLGGSGVYQLINEKQEKTEELPLKINVSTSDQPYKLLEPKESTAASNNKIVSKRIEFFEHSGNTKIGNGTGNGTLNTSNLSNGGLHTAANGKSKVFSIFKVNDINYTEQPHLSKDDNLKKEAGASVTLLKHDSHVLTMILSCVFIATFLLLVFFPLPA